MKILYVTTISDTVNAFLVPHIKWLIENGNEVAVAFNTNQEVNTEVINAGCKVHHVEFQRNPLKKENLKAYQKIMNVILNEGYDLIHVHTPVASFITRLACRNIKGVKILYTAHGFHFFKGSPKRNWVLYYTLEKIVSRWTDGLITMNEEDYCCAKKLSLRGTNSIYKIHGIGLDLNRFTPQTVDRKNHLRNKYGYKKTDFILIYVGELSYRKQQDLLIKAVSHLKEEIPYIKLLLVGEGERLLEYKELVLRNGLGNNVEFLGYRNDVHNLMAIADIAISTSRQEGLPVNVMEAMATGLPLVVTDCRGNRDLVTNGENGYIVHINDAIACAKGIKKLYQSSDLREAFAKCSKEKIRKYEIKQVLNEMKEIYDKQSLNL